MRRHAVRSISSKGTPSISTAPASGRMRPITRSTIVVLPDPDPAQRDARLQRRGPVPARQLDLVGGGVARAAQRPEGALVLGELLGLFLHLAEKGEGPPQRQ